MSPTSRWTVSPVDARLWWRIDRPWRWRKVRARNSEEIRVPTSANEIADT